MKAGLLPGMFVILEFFISAESATRGSGTFIGNVSNLKSLFSLNA